MDVKIVRNDSIKRAIAHGIKEDFGVLPCLDESIKVRSKEEIFFRAMCLNGVVAASFNPDVKRGIKSWMDSQGLAAYLTAREVAYINNQYFDSQYFNCQQECIYAIGWVMKMIPQIQLDQPVPLALTDFFPDLTRWQGIRDFQLPQSLRNSEEIFRELDFYYCIHWASKNAMLNRRKFPIRLPFMVFAERRRSLEWILSDEAFDEIALDT